MKTPIRAKVKFYTAEKAAPEDDIWADCVIVAFSCKDRAVCVITDRKYPEKSGMILSRDLINVRMDKNQVSQLEMRAGNE